MCNIVREKSGPTRYARICSTLSDCFLFNFWKPLHEEICKWTKKKVQRERKLEWSYNWWAKKCYCCVHIDMPSSYFTSQTEKMSILTDGRPIINKTIRRNRFQKLVRVYQFNDDEKWCLRRSLDKLEPIRSVFEMWNDSLLDSLVAGVKHRRTTSCLSMTLSTSTVHSI